VIGVAENSRRQDWVEEENFHIHLPLAQAPAWATRRVLVVRPAGADPERAIPAVRRALQDAAPGLPYTEVRPYEGVFANELRPWRIGAALFGLFGALAAVLVAVGLYGVIAFSVAQRTRELGVRIALGARAAGVLALVLRQGVLLAAAGGAIGLVVALGAARLVEPLLFRVPARDPAVLAGVALALLAVAAAATLVPAWRATRVDPAVALRDG
jgi:ABC-type lipoprotein release transport system permease subunit